MTPPSAGPEAAAYPTFVGLGARKAGTTLLHSWLADHPEVCVPADRKEVEFFTRHYHRGLDWYKSLFRPTTEKAIGEFSVTYLESDAAITRLARDLPEVKCIVSLRDPVQRVDSHFRDLARINGYCGPYRQLIAGHPEVIEQGRYGNRLATVLHAFSRERLHLILFEDAVTAPERVARGLYDFLGVDPDHLPSSLLQRVNPTPVMRSRRVQRLRERVKRVAVGRDLRWLLRLARSGPARRLQALNVVPDQFPAPALEPDVARELRETFEQDIRAVSLLLDRDLTEVWRTGAG